MLSAVREHALAQTMERIARRNKKKQNSPWGQMRTGKETDMAIIGGADGPTAIFITSSASWINWFGLIIVVLLLLPNAIYAIRHKDAQNKCRNRMMNVLEQIGRYGCMLLMVCNIGVAEFGYASVTGFIVYLLGNAVLILLYWAFWILYAKRPRLVPALMLAILPTLIFLLCGLTLRHWLLVGCGLLFGVAHIYVTAANAAQETRK